MRRGSLLAVFLLATGAAAVWWHAGRNAVHAQQLHGVQWIWFDEGDPLSEAPAAVTEGTPPVLGRGAGALREGRPRPWGAPSRCTAQYISPARNAVHAALQHDACGARSR